MRRVVRLIGFIALSLAFLVVALLLQPVLLFVSYPTRRRVMAFGGMIWARLLLRLIGMKVNPHGLNPEYLKTHSLLVCNHLSYLDIIIIASVFPIVFVARSDMQHWPLVGWLARLGGTIFIDRADPHSGVSCAYQASRMLRQGISVQVFPESTTGDGSGIQAFKALFFTSAIRAQAKILPLTINFQSINRQPFSSQNSDLLCWYGDMEFVPHFWELLRIDAVEVSLMIHPPIATSRLYQARALAQAAQARIDASFVTNCPGQTGAARSDRTTVTA